MAARTPLISTLLVGALVLGACSDGGGDGDGALGTTSTSAPSASTTTTSSTIPAPTTTSTTVPVDGLAPGMAGAEVEALQTRLAELKFDAGTIDGRYGGVTAQAVMAFQKLHGMDRTGRATTAVLEAMKTASVPGPLLPGAEPTRVEFDKKRQVLLVYKDGTLRVILNASSGSERPYCENGYCGNAKTPDGAYRITRRIDGWRHGPLGDLYKPLYFNGGIAIHGSRSVPGYPASHGCVRISMAAAEWLPGLLPNGTPVYVIGSTTPVPFNQRVTTTTAPPATTTTAPPATTTSTTAPPATTTSTTAPATTTTSSSSTTTTTP